MIHFWNQCGGLRRPFCRPSSLGRTGEIATQRRKTKTSSLESVILDLERIEILCFGSRRAGRNSKESRFTESFRLNTVSRVRARVEELAVCSSANQEKKNAHGYRPAAARKERGEERDRTTIARIQFLFFVSFHPGFFFPMLPEKNDFRRAFAAPLAARVPYHDSTHACHLFVFESSSCVRYNHAISSITVALLQLVLQKLDYLDRTVAIYSHNYSSSWKIKIQRSHYTRSPSSRDRRLLVS